MRNSRTQNSWNRYDSGQQPNDLEQNRHLTSNNDDKLLPKAIRIPEVPSLDVSSVEPEADNKHAFHPRDRRAHEPLQTAISLPDELWLAVLETPCTFPPEIFETVMLNLVKNPNVTSSHLFRADIFYDSEQDHHRQGLVEHLQAAYRPRPAQQWPGLQRERTIVRQLVPRNPQLDKPLGQTCHFFSQRKQPEQDDDNDNDDDDEEQNHLVLYIPHVERAEEVPFYHPTVSQLAFLHTWRRPTSSGGEDEPRGSLALLYRRFGSGGGGHDDDDDNSPLDTKLERTALKLLQTIHKHGQGQLRGYEKRVHHDRIIPQKRYQDTYTRLKTRYGKRLAEQWVEVTDPGKHVFEDIGIAAFLIELWRDMYQLPTAMAAASANSMTTTTTSAAERKPPFPGFVDIGCGNGILVFLLLSEGYPGWGFDARERKTWRTFPPHVQSQLHQLILVPNILQSLGTGGGGAGAVSDDIEESARWWHNGSFEPGTFIVSNHADELTAWTPLLAYWNESAFIAIPCCSHDLAGARFRAPATTRGAKETTPRLPQQMVDITVASNNAVCEGGSAAAAAAVGIGHKHAAETGSLQRTEAQKKMPSAYSTLCSYVASLAAELDFQPEQEILRIPSTRNSCIIGRHRHQSTATTAVQKARRVTDLVERELKTSVGSVAVEWIERAGKLMKKPGSGH